MKSLSKRLAIGLLAVALGVAGHAELAKVLTLDEKAAAAVAVVHAQCTETTTEWRNGKVFTRARFEVFDDLRASGMATIEIVNPGGTAVHPVLKVAVTTSVSDAVPIAVGDEVILFASRYGPQEFRVLAGAQGYLKVSRDAAGEPHVRAVERQVTATPAARGQPGGARLEAEAYSLEQYKQRIRARLREIK